MTPTSQAPGVPAWDFDRFFHLSQDLCCIAGFDGCFKCMNEAWQDVLGHSIETLMARPFLEFVHPDDREATTLAAEQLAHGLEVVSFANRYRHADGSYRWLLWKCRSQVSESLIYGSASDITAERDALARLETANARLAQQAAQLESTNRELESFSYSVSHDLRAPLRAIAGFAQAIEESDGARLSDDGQDALRRVRAAATRMGLLIDDLIDLSRLTRMEMRREPIDLSAMAASIVAGLRSREPDRRVDVSIAPAMLTRGDARMLRIALQNLLDNAWKYTSGREVARIDLSVRPGADGPEYQLRDNGAGFDMRYAGKLFGAFQRLHADPRFQGTGIGLATVQRVIHRHGGRISAESAPNAGATFTFTLGPGGAEAATT